MTGLLGVNRQMNEGTTSMSLGFEFGAGPMSLRASYRSDSGASGMKSSKGAGQIAENFSTGMGFKFGSFKLDYAISQPSEQLGMSHRMGLTFEWGATEAEVREAKVDPYSKAMNEKIRLMQPSARPTETNDHEKN